MLRSGPRQADRRRPRRTRHSSSVLIQTTRLMDLAFWLATRGLTQTAPSPVQPLQRGPRTETIDATTTDGSRCWISQVSNTRTVSGALSSSDPSLSESVNRV
ncbi:hypothetical protein LIA77_03288 [Sarocladium implicatum]|nr:hypothetical protein LIA77_03288 [Sarocladium implicatum]